MLQWWAHGSYFYCLFYFSFTDFIVSLMLILFLNFITGKSSTGPYLRLCDYRQIRAKPWSPLTPNPGSCVGGFWLVDFFLLSL